jgi:integrase
MPVRRNARGQWIYRKVVKLRDGKKVRVFGTPERNTKESAEQAERDHIDRVQNPRAPTVQKKEVPTFEKFAEQFMAIAKTKNKPSEVDTKDMILRVHLNPWFGKKRLDEVGYAEIQDYVARKLRNADDDKKGLSKKTVNNHLTVLRRLLMVAKKRTLIDSVPEIEWLKAPKPDFDFFDFDEAARLVTAADGEWRCMIIVALRTGLRQGELLALRWEDVDLQKGLLRVRQSVTRGQVTEPKSGRSRDVPLSDHALSALKLQRHLRGPLVFCAGDGRMLGKEECKHPLWRASKRAGLRRIGWHVLRHSFASHLAMRGVPLKVVQELLGHATMEMTMRYAHLSPNVPRDAVKLLDAGRGTHVAPNGATASSAAVTA